VDFFEIDVFEIDLARGFFAAPGVSVDPDFVGVLAIEPVLQNSAIEPRIDFVMLG